MRNILYEQKGVDTKWAKQIEIYHYNTRNKSDMSIMGVSTYGTLMTLISSKASLDKQLESVDATLDTFGVIGCFIDPDRDRVLVLSSSIKLMVTAWLLCHTGFSEGQLSSDVTFKIFKEKGLEMMTFMMQDPNQVGKLTAFGPTTHQDTEQFRLAGDIIWTAITKVVRNIGANTLPSEWSMAVKELIITTYSVKVLAQPVDKRQFLPGAVCADEANAINDGLCESKMGVNVKEKKTDWPHIIRAIIKWIKGKDSSNGDRLIDSSDARVTELITDITFLHECFVVDLLVHQLVMFKTKWDVKYGEHVLCQYLESQHFKRHFSRCHGPAGESSDTTALECFHRIFKGEGGFDTVEGMSTVVVRTGLVGYRLSRDTTLIAEVPTVRAPTWKKAQKLLEKGWANLGFKLNASYVFPSEKLIAMIPDTLTTVKEQRVYIKTWSVEYIAMRRNPKTYNKLTDGSWDLDILNDMMFSFWALSEITEHPKLEALRQVQSIAPPNPSDCNRLPPEPQAVHTSDCNRLLSACGVLARPAFATHAAAPNSTTTSIASIALPSACSTRRSLCLCASRIRWASCVPSCVPSALRGQ